MTTDQRMALINRAQLAEQLGVSRALVSRWFQRGWVPEHWVAKVSALTGLPKSALRR